MERSTITELDTSSLDGNTPPPPEPKNTTPALVQVLCVGKNQIKYRIKCSQHPKLGTTGGRSHALTVAYAHLAGEHGGNGTVEER